MEMHHRRPVLFAALKHIKNLRYAVFYKNLRFKGQQLKSMALNVFAVLFILVKR